MTSDKWKMKGYRTMDKKDVLREWRESAPYWARHADIVRAMFAPITNAIIEAAAIKDGEVVLDVAGGSGEPSLTIAGGVGPSTLIVFTDAVGGMIETARAQALDRALTNLEFVQAVAEALPFSTKRFDVVVCRLGVMLFPDPISAINEMLRVVKPGGRIVTVVWGAKDSNPFFHLVADIVSRYVESPPEDPDAPGAFRFATRSKLADLFRASAAADVTERVLDFTLEAPITPMQFWQMRSELSDTLRTKVAGLSTDEVNRLAKEVEQAGQAFYENDRMRFPGEVLIVTGTSPR